MTKKPTKDKKTATWIYGGRRLTFNCKLGDAYFPVDGDNYNDQVHPNLFAKGQHKKVIGGCYTGETSLDSKTVYGIDIWKYTGPASVPSDVVVEWNALDEAARADHADRRAHDKAIKDDVMYKLLEPLHRAYLKTNALGRRAIIAKVLYYVTKR